MGIEWGERRIGLNMYINTISCKHIKLNAVNAASVNVGRNRENKKVPRNTFF